MRARRQAKSTNLHHLPAFIWTVKGRRASAERLGEHFHPFGPKPGAFRSWKALTDAVSAREQRDIEIRSRHARGESLEMLRRKFGLSRSHIERICSKADGKIIPLRGRPLSAERVNRDIEIRRRYAEGQTASELGTEYGLSKSYIYRICNGVNRTKINAQRNAEMRARYAKGETQESIAKDFELSQTTVGVICRGVQREVTPKRGPAPGRNPELVERNTEIRRRRAEGETYASIAMDFDITRARVCQICKRVEKEP
jgi:Mor family transcriptional regulator